MKGGHLALDATKDKEDRFAAQEILQTDLTKIREKEAKRWARNPYNFSYDSSNRVARWC